MAGGKKKPGKSDYRKFGISVGCVFLVFAALTVWREHFTAARVLGSLGSFLLVAGLALPVALAWPYRAWMAFAHGLGWFNTRLLLVLVFYLMLTPLGLLMRILGKRPLNLEREPEAESYWITREQTPFDPGRCEKHF
jgi:saxitoxin biosynthesis operon SxtJ-like protein